MKIKYFPILLLFASGASGQGITTTVLSFESNPRTDCPNINFTLTRVQNEASLRFVIMDCFSAETIAQQLVLDFKSQIPLDGLSIDTQTGAAHLFTQSPYGPIQIDWIATGELRTKYDATWTVLTSNGNIVQSQSDDTQIVRAMGVVGQWNVDRKGHLTVSIKK